MNRLMDRAIVARAWSLKGCRDGSAQQPAATCRPIYYPAPDDRKVVCRRPPSLPELPLCQQPAAAWIIQNGKIRSSSSASMLSCTLTPEFESAPTAKADVLT